MIVQPFKHPIRVMIVLSVIAMLIAISGVLPWPELNCKRILVDIHSGRKRTTLHLLFIKVSDRIEETWVSKEIVKPAAPPEWRTVCQFAPCWRHISPNTVFHSAIAQIHMLQGYDNSIPFTPAARSQAAHRLIACWQSGDDGDAYTYLNQVGEVWMKASDRRQATIDVADLP